MFTTLIDSRPSEGRPRCGEPRRLRPASLAAERADRMIGRAVHADDFVADLEAGPVGRIAFQQHIDEVAPVDARGEDADAGVRHACAPEPPRSWHGPRRQPQHVVVDVVGRQQNGMRGLELVEQQIDATGRVLQVRRATTPARSPRTVRASSARRGGPCPRSSCLMPSTTASNRRPNSSRDDARSNSCSRVGCPGRAAPGAGATAPRPACSNAAASAPDRLTRRADAAPDSDSPTPTA